jgi:hypothetical protein
VDDPNDTGYGPWDSLWLVPLVFYLFLGIFWPKLKKFCGGLVAINRHFNFLIFWSPDYYLWLIVMFALLTLPWLCLTLIVFSFNPASNTYLHRYRWAALITAMTFLVFSALAFVAAGSWPLMIDAQNHVRVRIIPFLSCSGCCNIR